MTSLFPTCHSTHLTTVPNENKRLYDLIPTSLPLFLSFSVCSLPVLRLSPQATCTLHSALISDLRQKQTSAIPKDYKMIRLYSSNCQALSTQLMWIYTTEEKVNERLSRGHSSSNKNIPLHPFLSAFWRAAYNTTNWGRLACVLK